jgi:hypothetical protein
MTRKYKRKEVVDGHLHQERIDLYRKRYSDAKDLFTGMSLSATDYKDRKETERLKERTNKRGIVTNKHGSNQYANNEICS